MPKNAQSFVATMVRTIFAQPDAATVREQHGRIVAQLEQRFPEAAALLEAVIDLLAFTDFPKEHWRQLWSNNSLERLNKEIRRRTDVVGIFPDRGSIVRLVGAILAEQNDEWAVARRYMSADSIAKALTDTDFVFTSADGRARGHRTTVAGSNGRSRGRASTRGSARTTSATRSRVR